MCRGRALLVLLIGGLVACGEKQEPPPPVPEGPVEWEVTATADKSEIQVGEDLAVHEGGIFHPLRFQINPNTQCPIL